MSRTSSTSRIPALAQRAVAVAEVGAKHDGVGVGVGLQRCSRCGQQQAFAVLKPADRQRPDADEQRCAAVGHYERRVAAGHDGGSRRADERLVAPGVARRPRTGAPLGRSPARVCQRRHRFGFERGRFNRGDGRGVRLRERGCGDGHGVWCVRCRGRRRDGRGGRRTRRCCALVFHRIPLGSP